MFAKLAEAVRGLTHALGAFQLQLADESTCRRLHADLATKNDLNLVLHTIMSAISDFKAKFDEYVASNTVSVDTLVAALAGLTGDIANLNAQIVAIQNSPGTVSAEDQASLDSMQATIASATAAASDLAAKAAALDALTPPVAPKA